MKIFSTILSLNQIPIWQEFIFAENPPDLGDINQTFGFCGDFLFVEQVTDENLIHKIVNKALGKIKKLKYLQNNP